MSSPTDEDDLAPVVEIYLNEPADPTDALFGAARDEAAESDADHDLLHKLAPAIPNPPRSLRISTAVLAVVQLAVVLPWLVSNDPFGLLGDTPGSHLTRDGALGLVVAVAALLAAWRPRWALPSFFIGSSALIAQAAAGLIDKSHSGGANELIHLPSVVLAFMTGLSGIRLSDLSPSRRRP